MKSKIRKLLEKLKLLSPKPTINDNYLLWLKCGMMQANKDDSWRLER